MYFLKKFLLFLLLVPVTNYDTLGGLKKHESIPLQGWRTPACRPFHPPLQGQHLPRGRERKGECPARLRPSSGPTMDRLVPRTGLRAGNGGEAVDHLLSGQWCGSSWRPDSSENLMRVRRLFLTGGAQVQAAGRYGHLQKEGRKL